MGRSNNSNNNESNNREEVFDFSRLKIMGKLLIISILWKCFKPHSSLRNRNLFIYGVFPQYVHM